MIVLGTSAVYYNENRFVSTSNCLTKILDVLLVSSHFLSISRCFLKLKRRKFNSISLHLEELFFVSVPTAPFAEIDDKLNMLFGLKDGLFRNKL